MRPRADLSLQEESDFPEAVREQLEKVLASDLFRGSPKHQLLLRTIVNESLAGRTAALKEIVLAREVFGRPNYDPKLHTLVRVEANSVRHKLADYYLKAGAKDPICIEIPLGHYVANFSLRQRPGAGESHRAQWGVAITCVVVITIAAAFGTTQRWRVDRITVATQITFDTGWTSQPAVSSDGSVLVYSSDRGATGRAIWIQKPGKEPRQLTHDAAHDATPDISADGAKVAFRS
jgi:hypothetical protein